MHLELAVPALLGPPAADRLPALEMLLARARRTEQERMGLEQWFGKQFQLNENSLPAGALTALGCGLDPGERYWLRADPVHLRPDRDRVLIIPSQAFALGAAEAEQLGAALERHFSDRFRVKVARPDAWLIETSMEAQAGIEPPIALAGAAANAHLPDKRWHAILNEIQMALYQHAVNNERDARGELVVNSVWLWGGGRLPASARGPWQSVRSEDPVAIGLARLSRAQAGTLPGGAQEWLAQATADGRHLVVLDALRAPGALGDEAARAQALRSLEARWFAPLLEALKAGRIGMVTMHAPEAGLAFETIRADLRRFWRRPRPLSAYTG